ncbi:MAG: dihydroorotate dehydrogenase electron transfer subunit [Candidatus Aminicenantes bacterium]|nr:dihydroorotate dehydrogenase electron transfer subunit [Candidatus Aminicenantes bacterium]
MPYAVKIPIVRKQSWGDYHLFRFQAPEMAAAARPGQFVMIRPGESTAPLLRRPISIHGRDRGALEIFFQVAGEGTALLARRKAGDTFDVLGPLGRGFDLDAPLDGKTACLLGGGRGIAPLYFLALELADRGALVKVLYGGRTADDLPVRDRFEEAGLELACSTDDGSFGFPGLVTGLLETEIPVRRPDFLFVCGPDPMMKAAAGLASRFRIPAQISLESVMGCGFGACWGCVRRIKRAGAEAWRKICEDGPVFPAEDIVWEGWK